MCSLSKLTDCLSKPREILREREREGGGREKEIERERKSQFLLLTPERKNKIIKLKLCLF